jgi:nicotinate dehydrogenase subunit A
LAGSSSPRSIGGTGAYSATLPALVDWKHSKKTAEQQGAAREDTMAQRKSLNVNGKAVRITIDDPDMPLLYALRDNLALHGPRFGCGLAQCGACTVHVDGKAVRSCVTPLSSLTAQQKVVTLEGLGTPQRLHPVQRAFIEEQAVQCGYCINGMIMESAAFLAKTKKPTEAQVKDALASNLCRCGTHARIVKAVMRAAGA